MSRMRKHRAIVVLIAVLGILVASCGGDEGEGSTTIAAEETTTTAAEQPATTEASDETSTTAAAGGWEDTVEAAQGEGPATFSGTEVQEWIDAVGSAFQDGTGVEFAATPRAATGAILERFSAEQEAGAQGTDVLLVADHSVWVDNPDWFLDLSTAGMPNYESYPEEHKWADKCVNITLVTGGILYNADLVPEEQVPAIWEDLLDPYWEGRFALTDPRASPTYNGWSFLMEQEYGPEFLETIAGHSPDLFDSASPAAEQVAAGAYEVSAMSHITNSSGVRAAGAPVEYVIPEGPTVGHGSCAGIAADAPHPDAAKVLLNDLMSPAAQSTGCDAGVENASPLDDTTCTPLPDGWTPTPKDPETGQFLGQTDEEGQERIYGLLGLE